MVDLQTDQAPLGLDFEMPEKVWAWTGPRGFLLSLRVGEYRLRVGAVSGQALMDTVRPHMHKTAITGEQVSSGHPELLSLEEWLHAPINLPIDACALYMEGGQEIWRQYVR